MNRKLPLPILAAIVAILLAGCGSSTPKSEPPTNDTTEPVTEGSAAEPAAAGACTTDADCRLFSDYCTGCDCRALARSEPDPTCDGPGVRCIADPCGTKTAVCTAGTCTAADRTP